MRKGSENPEAHGGGADPAHPAAHDPAAATGRAAGLRLPGQVDRAPPGGSVSPARRSSATGPFASRATASFTSTRRKPPTCSRRSKTSCTTGAKATRCGWKSIPLARRPIREALLKTLRLTEDDLYLIDGPLNPTRLMVLYQGDHSPELRDPPFVAPMVAPLRDKPDLFAADSRAGHPAASSVRKLQQRGRLPRTGRRRSGRAGDQADSVSHRRRSAHRRRAGECRQERQTGDRRGGIARAVRRGQQHPVGAPAWKKTACTWFTGWSATRSTRKAASSSGAKASTSAATFISPPAITTPPPPGFIPTWAC